jgi:hypothetical protein
MIWARISSKVMAMATLPLSGLFRFVRAKMTQNDYERKRDTARMKAGATCHRLMCGCLWSAFRNGRKIPIRNLWV